MQRACTHITRSFWSLLELSRLLQRRVASSPGQVLVFSIAPSPNIEATVLSAVASSLSKISQNHVGCISHPLPYQSTDPDDDPGVDRCSLSLALVDGVSFRSAIPGRPEPQVGRWHAGRQRNAGPNHLGHGSAGSGQGVKDAQTQLFNGTEAVDWEKLWDRTVRSFDSLGGTQTGQNALPHDLRSLDPSTVHDIVYFSDKSPQGIASVLEGAFPSANKLSLIASSTPFLTGRPVTLFHNGQVHSDGAVGVALTSHTASPPPAVDLAFPPLVALTPDVVVTSSEGNLILSLDFGNPTRLLLAAIQKHGLSLSAGPVWIGKEDEFYVGVLESDVIVQLHRINSGDPSRGTIALDTSAAPREGRVVRLYHLPRGEPHYPFDAKRDLPPLTFFVAPETSPESLQPSATFSSSVPPSEVKPQDECDAKHAVQVKHPNERQKKSSGILMSCTGTFYAASENGFTLSRGNKGSTTASEGPWTCVVPGGRVGLMFDVPQRMGGSEDGA
ncbi:hypothetical protein F5I97DRAFT_1340042 [Phlebopus sp. FC_14]|nr:hypothetical protein F5I97DRAFT_1340042 [Phlebopus sp. FC_14]